MDFNTFLNKAWEEHGESASEVALRLASGIDMIQESAQIPSLAHLITHVCGEHLGNWDLGLSLLSKLSNHAMVTADSQSAIARSVAALKLAQDPAFSLQGFSDSDLARVYAVSAAALAGQGDMQGANTLLGKAIETAAALPAKDPAQRALAVAGNNLAVGLEQKSVRTTAENELMVRAAALGLEKWQVAGGWLEASRAHYRMAKSLLLADRAGEALNNARTCLRICYENSAGPLDMFFAFEIMSHSNLRNGRESDARENLEMASSEFVKLSESDRTWAEKDFAHLQAIFSEQGTNGPRQVTC